MIQFSYDINSDQVERALAGFQGALADNAPALREIADDFREMIAQQFASEGQAEGTPWAARKTSRQPQTWRKAAMSAPALVARTGRGNASPLQKSN